MKTRKESKLMLYSGHIYTSKRHTADANDIIGKRYMLLKKIVIFLIRWICIVLAEGCACAIWPESYDISYHHDMFIPAAALITFVFGILSLLIQKRWLIYGLYGIVFGSFGYWFADDIKNGFGVILKEIIGSMQVQFSVDMPEWLMSVDQTSFSVTVFIIFFASAIASVVIIYKIDHSMNWLIGLTFFITAGTVLLSGEILPQKYVAVFMAASIILISFNKSKSTWHIGQGTSIHAKVAVGAVIICTVLWFASTLVVTEDMYLDKSDAQQMKEAITKHLDDISAAFRSDQSIVSFFSSGDDISGGRLDEAGNRQFDGTSVLEVNVDVSPKKTIYLKGFVGGDFIDHRWEPVDEDAFLNIADTQAEVLDIWNVQSKSFAAVNAADTMKIIYLNDSAYCFAPYAALVDEEMQVYGDGWIEYAPNDKFNYYSSVYDIPESYFFTIDSIADSLMVDNMSSSLAEYEDYVYKTYLQIPRQTMEDKDYEHLKDIFVLEDADLGTVLDHIRTQLHSHAVYTLSPGTLPDDVDFLSYFVLESHEGYCMHFASAAALLLRMNGFPARYAEGYICPADEFERHGADGFKGIVRDDYAHAWVEVYLGAYGWVPVEMTPGYENSAQISHVLDEQLEERSDKTGLESESNPFTDPLEIQQDSDDRTKDSDDRKKESDDRMESSAEDTGTSINSSASNDESMLMDDQSTDKYMDDSISKEKIILPGWFTNILKVVIFSGAAVLAVLARMILKSRYYHKLFAGEDRNASMLALYGALNHWLRLAGAENIENLTGTERVAVIENIKGISAEMFIAFESAAWKAAFGAVPLDKHTVGKGFEAYEHVVGEIKSMISLKKYWFAKIVLCLPEIHIKVKSKMENFEGGCKNDQNV